MAGGSFRTSPAGVNWQPPQDLRAGMPLGNLSADMLRSLMEQVALLSRQPTEPGIYSAGIGWHPDAAVSTSGQLVLLTMQDALLPGTFDLPGVGQGLVMAEVSGNRMVATGELLEVVNYSTSIYAPIGGGISAQYATSGKLVAVGSF